MASTVISLDKSCFGSKIRVEIYASDGKTPYDARKLRSKFSSRNWPYANKVEGEIGVFEIIDFPESSDSKIRLSFKNTKDAPIGRHTDKQDKIKITLTKADEEKVEGRYIEVTTYRRVPVYETCEREMRYTGRDGRTYVKKIPTRSVRYVLETVKSLRWVVPETTSRYYTQPYSSNRIYYPQPNYYPYYQPRTHYPFYYRPTYYPPSGRGTAFFPLFR